MHELSIAHSIVGTVSTSLKNRQRVLEVRLRVGALSAVSKDSLAFCYDIAAQDTALAGSNLVVTELPVIIYCSVCGGERELPGVQRFRCPSCDTPSAEIRQGRELEIESVVVHDSDGC